MCQGRVSPAFATISNTSTTSTTPRMTAPITSAVAGVAPAFVSITSPESSFAARRARVRIVASAVAISATGALNSPTHEKASWLAGEIQQPRWYSGEPPLQYAPSDSPLLANKLAAVRRLSISDSATSGVAEVLHQHRPAAIHDGNARLQNRAPLASASMKTPARNRAQ